VPGLKCVVPSDAYTAKGLMIAAIRDDDPVMYFSHRRLLGASCDVPEEPYVVPIGQARTLRAGTDVTLVGIGRMTGICLEAAETLAREGCDAEVIDLLSVAPWDQERVLDAVRRTKHLVIVDEDTPRCSVASDIAGVVAEQAIDYLDGPIKAVTGAHAPVPYSGPLEAAFVPTPERVVAAVHATRDGADWWRSTSDCLSWATSCWRARSSNGCAPTAHTSRRATPSTGWRPTR
jgi:acetoin:2,6-dichlorophenolindophenol oxidoreductase subunit beta